VFRARVTVTLRKSILDPQGRTVERSLHNLGYSTVNNVRVGKEIEFDLDLPREQAEEQAREIAERVLANPVIETYAVELLEVEPA
jgi:phosphoribosylformylglycinamidine synthase PurS subunit